MKSIIVWYNPKKNVYFYKIIYNFWDRYYEGYVNQYGHICILIIDIYKDLIYKEPLRKMVLKKFISFLQKIYKNL